MKTLFFILFSISLFKGNCLRSQTSISSGLVSGTWQKSGSPYKVNGNVYIPKGSKLTITEGVTVEFQGNYKLDAWGTLQVLGRANDTVVFTSKDKTAGWSGIQVHNQSSATDSTIFTYMKYELIGNQTPNIEPSSNYGLLLDTIAKLRISNCVFQNNKAKVTSCFFARKCTMTMYSVGFTNNKVYDATTVTGGGSAGLPGCAVINSTYTISNCTFVKNNRNLPNYTNGNTPGGIVTIYNSQGIIKKCTFKDNGNTSQYKDGTACISLQGQLTFNLENSVFHNNEIGISVDQISSANFFNDSFKSNKYGILLATTGSGSISVSTIALDSCVFISNTDNRFIINHPLNQTLTIKNHKNFGGDYGLGLYKVNTCNISNSIFANATLGISSTEGVQLNISNSAICNNKNKSLNDAKADSSGSGISIGDGDNLRLTNCVLSGNRSADGKLKNIDVSYEFSPAYVYASNCVIEGGKKSIGLQNSSNLQTYSNIIETTPLFVNPTTGAGPGYDASLADWHPLNTCAGLSNVFNAGTSTLPFGAGLPTYDLDGNPRVAQKRVDIGPYEIQSNVLPRVLTQPKDTAFCPEAIVNMMPFTAVGAKLNYSWQSSTDGNSWTSINNQSASQLNGITVPKSDTRYYRSIILNPDCGKGDTTKSAMLTVYPAPKPNLGADQKIPNNGSAVLNPGSFSAYQWYKGATTPTYTVNNTNLDTGKNTVWVEVTDAKGCKGRDTVIIDLRPVNGLKTLTEAGIKLYPIPAGEVLNISVPNSSTSNGYNYELRDLQGKVIIPSTPINDNNTSISLKNVPSGVYVFTIETQGNYYSAKLMKR